jgi:hypothetical protein
VSAGRCAHTGLSIPECSCSACCRRLVAGHAPWLLVEGAEVRRTVSVPRAVRRPALRAVRDSGAGRLGAAR